MGTHTVVWTVAEFAKTFRISESTTYGLIREKKVRARKINRRTVIFYLDNEDWISGLPFLAADGQ